MSRKLVIWVLLLIFLTINKSTLGEEILNYAYNSARNCTISWAVNITHPRIKWIKRIGPAEDVYHTLFYYQQTLYVGDPEQRKMFLFDPETGERKGFLDGIQGKGEIRDGILYTCGETTVKAIRLSDQKIIWEKKRPMYSPPYPGITMPSPVVIEVNMDGVKRKIVCVGGEFGRVYVTPPPGPRIVAFDAETGEKLWEWVPDDGEVLASPVFPVGDGKIFAVSNVDVIAPSKYKFTSHLYAIDPATGQTIWEKLIRKTGPLYLTPAFADGYVYYISGFKHSSMGGPMRLWRVKADNPDDYWKLTLRGMKWTIFDIAVYNRWLVTGGNELIIVDLEEKKQKRVVTGCKDIHRHRRISAAEKVVYSGVDTNVHNTLVGWDLETGKRVFRSREKIPGCQRWKAFLSDFLLLPGRIYYTNLGNTVVCLEQDPSRVNRNVPRRKNLLSSSYPNPMNPECYIPLNVKCKRQNAKCKIYNILGQLVREIECSRVQELKGSRVYWDGKDNRGLEVPSGVYFYEVAGKEVRKTVVLR